MSPGDLLVSAVLVTLAVLGAMGGASIGAAIGYYEGAVATVALAAMGVPLGAACGGVAGVILMAGEP